MATPVRWSCLLAYLFLCSCAASRPATPPTNTLEISATDYPRFFQAAVLTLRDAGFQIDRDDYRFGRITTLPLAQSTALEFWRPTTTHAADPLHSTLNFQRLTASISLEPFPDGSPSPSRAPAPADGPATPALPPPAYVFRVEVAIEQLERPASYVTGSTSHVFASLSRSPAELAQRGIPALYWQPVGRDATLEHDLLQRILRRSTRLPDERSPDPHTSH